jgi:peptide/nickel transport system permease protein
MIRYLIKRISAALVTLIVASLAVSLLIHVVPGDPVLVMMSQSVTATPEAMEEMRERLGLNLPVWQQYIHFMGRVLRGDMGKTIMGNEPVLDLLIQRLPNTLMLAVSGLVIAVLVGIPLGFIAAYNKGKPIDSVLMLTAIFGVSIPTFWLGLMLLVTFSLVLNLLPVAGSGPLNLILPAITLGVTYSAVVARMTRSSLIEVLSEDFIRNARAKGLPERIVLFRHALRPALISVVTIIGYIFGYLMGGQIIVENVFSWDGIGRLALQAMLQRDYPLIQGFILIFATIIVSISVLLDIIYGILDPRITYE